MAEPGPVALGEAEVAVSSEPSPTEFRSQVQHFFDVVLPPVLAAADDERLARAKAYRAALFDAGLTGLGYDVDIGGQGLSPEHQRVWAETSSGRVPAEDSMFGLGVGMALPTIIEHGTAEMIQRFAVPTLRGDEVWCQLYSEPGSGSDLASLSTRAVLDGDEWVISGQKVWTSGAQHADLAILLARTDLDAPKHRGITMLVLPMKQPGVTVRPLRQITGDAEFNEVFLDEARAPGAWVVGSVNDGWRTAVALLAHERVQTGVASMANPGRERIVARIPIPYIQLEDLAREQGRLDDPTVRQKLAQLYIGEQIVGVLRKMGTHPSIGKLWRTKQGWAAAQLASELAFPGAPAWSADDDNSAYFAFHILNCRGMSMGGGTDEIQKNTLGERVLGLPREPTVDRDVPFRDLKVGTQR